jgi:hypothetical protein
MTCVQMVEEGSATAALRAALGVASSVTGLGPPCYEPASVAGGGLVDAPACVMDTMFCTPHTGIIYTPPRFSDHVAVSCLLQDDVRDKLPGTAPTAAARSDLRLAQPHKHTPPITAFFKAAPTSQGLDVVDNSDTGKGCCSAGAKRTCDRGNEDVQNRKSAVQVSKAVERLFNFGSKGK